MRALQILSTLLHTFRMRDFAFLFNNNPNTAKSSPIVCFQIFFSRLKKLAIIKLKRVSTSLRRALRIFRFPQGHPLKVSLNYYSSFFVALVTINILHQPSFALPNDDAHQSNKLTTMDSSIYRGNQLIEPTFSEESLWNKLILVSTEQDGYISLDQAKNITGLNLHYFKTTENTTYYKAVATPNLPIGANLITSTFSGLPRSIFSIGWDEYPWSSTCETRNDIEYALYQKGWVVSNRRGFIAHSASFSLKNSTITIVYRSNSQISCINEMTIVSANRNNDPRKGEK